VRKRLITQSLARGGLFLLQMKAILDLESRLLGLAATGAAAEEPMSAGAGARAIRSP